MAPLAICSCQAGFETCSYQGQKMSGHDKFQSMESLRSNAVNIMVCTTAFGMGIDQPDVEVVIRVGCPKSLGELVGMENKQKVTICYQYISIDSFFHDRSFVLS